MSAQHEVVKSEKTKELIYIYIYIYSSFVCLFIQFTFTYFDNAKNSIVTIIIVEKLKSEEFSVWFI